MIGLCSVTSLASAVLVSVCMKRTEPSKLKYCRMWPSTFGTPLPSYLDIFTVDVDRSLKQEHDLLSGFDGDRNNDGTPPYVHSVKGLNGTIPLSCLSAYLRQSRARHAT